MEDAVVDFVCPQCGRGSRRYLREIPERDFVSDVHYQPPLFHADLRCVSERCDSHAIVHTLAGSGKPNAGPEIPVPNWKLVGIRCYEGHLVKEPLQVIALRVTHPADE